MVEEHPEVKKLKERVEAKTARLRKEVKALELAPKYVRRFLNIYLRINKLVGQETIMGCSHERFLKDLMFGARSPKEWDDKSLGWIDMHLREVERTLMRFDRYPDMIGRIRTLEEELKACQNRCRELERGSGWSSSTPSCTRGLRIWTSAPVCGMSCGQPMWRRWANWLPLI